MKIILLNLFLTYSNQTKIILLKIISLKVIILKNILSKVIFLKVKPNIPLVVLLHHWWAEYRGGNYNLICEYLPHPNPIRSGFEFAP